MSGIINTEVKETKPYFGKDGERIDNFGVDLDEFQNQPLVAVELAQSEVELLNIVELQEQAEVLFPINDNESEKERIFIQALRAVYIFEKSGIVPPTALFDIVKFTELNTEE